MDVADDAARRFLVSRHMLAPARSVEGGPDGVLEAYNKGLSLVLTSDFPWFRANLSVRSPRILAEHADVAEHVLERIRAEGPLSALDFERRRGPLVDWFGAPTNVVRAVLEAYAATGAPGSDRAARGAHRGGRARSRYGRGRAASRASSTRCKPRHTLTSTSPTQAGSSGHRTSEWSTDASSRGRRTGGAKEQVVSRWSW